MTLPQAVRPIDRVALRTRLAEVVGAAHVLCDTIGIAPYLAEDRGLYSGSAYAVVRPGSTAEVAACVAICCEAGVPVVPQGGNTGVVGGGVPHDAVVIATGRLNRIREIDPLNNTMTAEAGCVLASLRAAAEEAGRLFPLSLSSEGSCQIGGNLATNAGGSNVLRYGNARDLCLGLEVVLPDGRVLCDLSRLRKNNTGYDLTDLFIGAEGTLGIITAAVLTLTPRPVRMETALIACADARGALELYDRMQARHAGELSMYEYIERFGIDTVLAHIPGAVDPMAEAYPAYVLLVLEGLDPNTDLRARLEDSLEEAHEAGVVLDAVIGASEAQRSALCALREGMNEAQKALGGNAKHDISVPVSCLADFLEVAVPTCLEAMPEVRPCVFGHFGDGNLHFNLIQPPTMDRAVFEAQIARLHEVVYDIVSRFGGSISAEHGIGLMKRAALRRYKDPVALEVMERIKAALDPEGLMNPGKIL